MEPSTAEEQETRSQPIGDALASCGRRGFLPLGEAYRSLVCLSLECPSSAYEARRYGVDFLKSLPVRLARRRVLSYFKFSLNPTLLSSTTRLAMSNHDRPDKPVKLEHKVANLKIEDPVTPDFAKHGAFGVRNGESSPSNRPPLTSRTVSMETPNASQRASQAPSVKSEEVVGGDITVRFEPGKAPKLSRSSSHKVAARQLQLFDDLPDKTPEAIRSFEVIEQCTYANKYLGDTEHALECDCSEEWGRTLLPNVNDSTKV